METSLHPERKPSERKDLLVIGMGNSLRGDDGVGLHLVRRLKARFGDRLDGLEIHAPDILLAETAAGYERLIIIDAMRGGIDTPFVVTRMKAGNLTPCGFASHLMGWDAILEAARVFFGHAPETHLVGISAQCFGFSEELSERCMKNADAVFEFLCNFSRTRRRQP